MMVIYKYTCTLTHNYAFSQHTHMIFSEKKNEDYCHCMCCTDKNMCDIKQHATSPW